MFKLDIDYKIKHIWFFKNNERFKKKNYMFVTNNDELIIKGLAMIKGDSSKIAYYIFNKYMKKDIIKGKILFKYSDIYQLIMKEIQQNISLVARTIKVNKPETYKVSHQIQAQISKKYGKGKHILIPNNFYGVGKSIKYCTIQEFKEQGLKMNHLILNKMWKELEPFLTFVPKTKKAQNISKGQVLLSKWSGI